MTTLAIPTETDLVRNPKADFTLGQHIENFESRSYGGFRTIDVAQKALALTNAVRAQAGQKPCLPELQSQLGTAKAILAVPYLPTVIKGASESIDALQNKEGVTPKMVATAVRNTAEAAAITGYVVNLVARNTTVGTMATIADTVNDVTDFGIRVHNYNEITALQERVNAPDSTASEDVKKNVEHTRTFAMLRVAKAVCAAVSALLGLAMLATGVAVLPAIALLVISFATSMFALISDGYKQTRPYELFNAYTS